MFLCAWVLWCWLPLGVQEADGIAAVELLEQVRVAPELTGRVLFPAHDLSESELGSYAAGLVVVRCQEQREVAQVGDRIGSHQWVVLAVQDGQVLLSGPQGYLLWTRRLDGTSLLRPITKVTQPIEPLQPGQD